MNRLFWNTYRLSTHDPEQMNSVRPRMLPKDLGRDQLQNHTFQTRCSTLNPVFILIFIYYCYCYYCYYIINWSIYFNKLWHPQVTSLDIKWKTHQVHLLAEVTHDPSSLVHVRFPTGVEGHSLPDLFLDIPKHVQLQLGIPEFIPFYRVFFLEFSTWFC